MSCKDLDMSKRRKAGSTQPPVRYKRVKVLGSGTYGVIYLYRKEGSDKLVVRKVARRKNCECLKAEARICKYLMEHELDKANIIKYHGKKHLNSSMLCLEFEALDIDMVAYLTEYGCMPLDDVRTVILQLAVALAGLKKVGVIHSDLKLDNVMVVDRFTQPIRVKLIDFGLAVYTALAKAEKLCIPICYRPPEVLLRMEVSEAVDIWTLGCMMAQLLFGHLLFDSNNDCETLGYIIDFLGPPPQSLIASSSKRKVYFKKDGDLWVLKEFLDHCEAQRPPTFRNPEEMKMLLEKEFPTEANECWQCIELLKAMLTWDAKDRITPEGILNHPFITKSYGQEGAIPSHITSADKVLKGVYQVKPAPRQSTFDFCDLTGDALRGQIVDPEEASRDDSDSEEASKNHPEEASRDDSDSEEASKNHPEEASISTSADKVLKGVYQVKPAPRQSTFDFSDSTGDALRGQIVDPEEASRDDSDSEEASKNHPEEASRDDSDSEEASKNHPEEASISTSADKVLKGVYQVKPAPRQSTFDFSDSTGDALRGQIVDPEEASRDDSDSEEASKNHPEEASRDDSDSEEASKNHPEEASISTSADKVLKGVYQVKPAPHQSTYDFSDSTGDALRGQIVDPEEASRDDSDSEEASKNHPEEASTNGSEGASIDYPEKASIDDTMGDPEDMDSEKSAMSSEDADSSTKQEVGSTQLPGNYKLVKVLESGICFITYLCQQQGSDEQVVLKVPQVKEGEAILKAEAAICEDLMEHELDKANIIKYHGESCLDGKLCLEFEAQDIDMLTYVIDNGCLRLDDIRTVIQQLAVALEGLKKVGVIHSALKLENIMIMDRLTQPIKVKLTDFGFALYLREADAVMLCMRSKYSPPEVLLGMEVSEAIDVWTLGCVMVDMLFFKDLFPSDNDYETLRYIIDFLGPPPQSLIASSSGREVCFKKDGDLWVLKEFLDHCESQRPPTFRNPEEMKMLLEKEFPTEANECWQCIELLKAMLTWDAKDRITPEGIPNHPFITKSYGQEGAIPSHITSADKVLKGVYQVKPAPRQSTYDFSDSTGDALRGQIVDPEEASRDDSDSEEASKNHPEEASRDDSDSEEASKNHPEEASISTSADKVLKGVYQVKPAPHQSTYDFSDSTGDALRGQIVDPEEASRDDSDSEEASKNHPEEASTNGSEGASIDYPEKASIDDTMGDPEDMDSEKSAMSSEDADSSTKQEVGSTQLPGNYKLVKVLESGICFNTYLCQQQGSDEQVVLKVPQVKEGEAILKAEAQICEDLMEHELDKANIIKYHGESCLDGKLCLEFEAQDIDMLTYVIDNGCLRLDDIRTVIQQLAVALEGLKKVGVIHSALKLENIMIMDRLTQPIKVKLTDFGFALYLREADAVMLCMRSKYSPPEVLLGMEVSEAIDVWTLGCVMVDMLFFKDLFPSDNDYETLRYIIDFLGPPPQSLIASSSGREVCFKKDGDLWVLKEFLDHCESQRPPTFRNPEEMKMLLEKEFPTEANECWQCIELLKAMLTWDAKDRITPEGILNHPFITKSYGQEGAIPSHITSADKVLKGVYQVKPAPRQSTYDFSDSTGDALRGQIVDPEEASRDDSDSEEASKNHPEEASRDDSDSEEASKNHPEEASISTSADKVLKGVYQVKPAPHQSTYDFSDSTGDALRGQIVDPEEASRDDSDSEEASKNHPEEASTNGSEGASIDYPEKASIDDTMGDPEDMDSEKSTSADKVLKGVYQVKPAPRQSTYDFSDLTGDALRGQIVDPEEASRDDSQGASIDYPEKASINDTMGDPEDMDTEKSPDRVQTPIGFKHPEASPTPSSLAVALSSPKLPSIHTEPGNPTKSKKKTKNCFQRCWSWVKKRVNSVWFQDCFPIKK